MTKPIIDPEFHALIPPPSEDERIQLEANIRAEGCRDALVIWDGIILDGHNRFEICERLKMEYRTKAIELKDRAAAVEWIIRNQFGRRNLSAYQRAELALKLEPIIAAKAKDRMLAGKSDPVQKSSQGKTRESLASVAGVKLAEAPSSGKSIFLYAPHSHAAGDYLALCKEIIKRSN